MSTFEFAVANTPVEEICARIAAELAPEATPEGVGPSRYHGTRTSPTKFALERQVWIRSRYGMSLVRVPLEVDVIAEPGGARVRVRATKEVATWVPLAPAAVGLVASPILGAIFGLPGGMTSGIVTFVFALFGGIIAITGKTYVKEEQAFLMRCASANNPGAVGAKARRNALVYSLVFFLVLFVSVVFVASFVAHLSGHRAR
jgi:hypothetical protein